MSTLIVNHKVKDYSVWKPLFDADKARRESVGLTLLAVGVSADDPNMVYAVFDSSNPSAVEEMLGDPEMAKIMEEAGVISEPNFVWLN